ncbi:leptin-B-like [Scleropages formosus]|uniref:Leptin n=1 Tax=Scleropages formosus TaxID=113540 RepID=A0A8C9R3B9_SCLFO|nr:leptin-B-like [Scleropages formosus]
MIRFISILCSSILMLLSTSTGKPLAVDIVKNNVKLLAQTTIVRIEKLTEEFHMSPNMVFSGLELIPETPLDRPIEGLASIMENLNIFQMILFSLEVDGMSQIHADLVSLQGIIHSLVLTFNCALPKPGSESHLDAFLKTNSAFHVTIGNVALNRLQRFLSKLILNLDQLKTC